MGDLLTVAPRLRRRPAPAPAGARADRSWPIAVQLVLVTCRVEGAASGITGCAGGRGVVEARPASATAAVVGATTRPQLTDGQAPLFTSARYLAQAGTVGALVVDNWDPTAGLGDAAHFIATFAVAPDGSGTHATVQAAVNAASGSARQYILVRPGIYRETVWVGGSTPITLYGGGLDASQVVIVNGRSAADAGGTAESATMTATSPDFQVMNLTVWNDFSAAAHDTKPQAVALHTTGDRVVLQNVRLRGFQDTLYLDSPAPLRVARVYIRDSFIEGDMDFVFGRATAVIEHSTIHYRSSRRGSDAGVYLAPSTSIGNPFGFLVVGCAFTADAAAPVNKIALGRSWDHSGTRPTPNGQAVIRESDLGVHIDRVRPWAPAATSGRPYSAGGNRFSEYHNRGPGAAP